MLSMTQTSRNTTASIRALILVLAATVIGCSPTPKYQQIPPEAQTPQGCPMLKYGARVFTYPGMSHVKAAVYDGWACLGSADFDKLSFRVNKEMNLGCSAPAFMDDLLESAFTPDFEPAVELRRPLPAVWHNTVATIIASQL
jgi:hypothetical protein